VPDSTNIQDVSIVVLADIHGNRWALEAVLADIGRRGIDQLVNLGDSLYGPLDPAGTAEILLPLNIPTVRGNEDRIIVRPPEDENDSPTLSYIRNQLSSDHIHWLESLELTITAHAQFLAFHGTPQRDDEYLLEELTEAGVRPRNPLELMQRLPPTEQPVILCGHSHVPRTIHLPDGRIVVNPGSVGLQAYTDDAPYPHAMQTGTPHARYAILSHDNNTWQAEEIVIEYDWIAASATALSNGRPDWAAWLRTGCADAN